MRAVVLVCPPGPAWSPPCGWAAAGPGSAGRYLAGI